MWRLAGIAATVVSALSLTACGHIDSSAQFAQNMSAHHAQAVEMASIALTRMDPREDSLLWAISTDIMLTQSNQIGRMHVLLEQDGQPLVPAAGAHTAGGEHETEMPGMASPRDIALISALPKGEALRTYIDLMIAHHVGGVEMAEEALQDGVLPPAERIAQAVITGQAGEIVALKESRKQYE